MQTETATINVRSLTIYRNIIVSLAFFIPFLISGPQILTGTLVNYLLILSTRFVDKKNHWKIAILPSIAAILNGLVFGKFTIFLVYFLPFIWIGNFVLIKSIIYLRERLPLSLSLLSSVFIKTIILYFAANIYFRFNIVPEVFLTAMGIFQLATGLIGGILFLGINKLIKVKN